MRCDEVQERFVDLLYSERGTPIASPALQAHIDSCPSCRKELEELRGVRSTLRLWQDEPPLRPVYLPVEAKPLIARKITTWQYLRYAAAAAMAVLAFLALANAEYTSNERGVTFKTHLFKQDVPAGDYYTKAEVRDVLSKVLDDSEARSTQSTYRMIQLMMDTLEQERSQDLLYVRRNSRQSPVRN